MSKKFTKMQELEIIRVYKKNFRVSATALAFRCSPTLIRRILLRNHITIQKVESHNGGYVPTKEQIEDDMEEIQRGWSDSTRREREVQKAEPLTVTRVNDGHDRNRKLKASERND